jgi:hypothetical protein
MATDRDSRTVGEQRNSDVSVRMKLTLHLVTSFLSIVILVSVSGKVSNRHKKKVSSLKIYSNKTQKTQNMLEIFYLM